MCYVVYLSTTSKQDLGRLGGGLFQLSRVDASEEQPAVALLRHPNQWFVESKYGSCSCHFRHWMEVNGDEFGPPVDRFPEDAEEVESTAAFYDVVTGLVSSGESADVVDVWFGTPAEQVRSIEVSLAEVDRNSFRFFENARFQFTP